MESSFLERKKVTQFSVVVDGNVQVNACCQQARVPGSPNFGQCPATREGMANEGVTTVVHGQCPQPWQSKHLTGGQKPPA
jgi:hypothetical protein